MSDGSTYPGSMTIRRVSDADAAVLDALLESRSGGIAPMPGGATERLQRVTDLLTLLEADASDPAPADLTRRTLSHVQHHRQQQRFATQVEMLREPARGLGFNWGQFMSAAGIFVVAMALLLPVLDRSRADAQRLACAGNLATAGHAFGSYAAANAGVLPRGAAKPGSLWWNVGKAARGEATHSNSAHLYLLVSSGHASAADLACPSNAEAQTRFGARDRDWSSFRGVSYSYQNQYTPEAIRLDRQPLLALLADKNPLFINGADGVAYDGKASAGAPSRNHGSRGQNILAADGSVTWTVRPYLRRAGSDDDNVWTVPWATAYTGRETPTTDGSDLVDSFLVP